MTDQSNESGAESQPTADEMALLKSRAKLMGIAFSNNIGIEALRAKVNAKLSDDAAEEAAEEDDVAEQGEPEAPPAPAIVQAVMPTHIAPAAPVEAAPVKVRKKTLRQHLLETEMKLVRLRITNLDPKKKDLHGEIITVANEFLGTVRKFIPFGEVTDDGFHVPYCLYKILEDRKFLDIRTRKGKNGAPVITQKWVREFALEVLPPLTQDELKQLAAAQAAAGLFGTDDD